MRGGAAALACAAIWTSAAGAMPVADFLAKADALKAKGMMALLSSDIGVLKQETASAGKAWRAQVAPPGRKPNACPPPGSLQMNSDDFLALLQAVPPPQRASTSVADAVTRGLNRRFPCPA